MRVDWGDYLNILKAQGLGAVTRDNLVRELRPAHIRLWLMSCYYEVVLRLGRLRDLLHGFKEPAGRNDRSLELIISELRHTLEVLVLRLNLLLILKLLELLRHVEALLRLLNSLLILASLFNGRLMIALSIQL